MVETTRMSERDFILMIQYAMEKDSITEIARKLNFSRNTIYKKFSQYNIPFLPSQRNVESIATLSPELASIQFDMKTLTDFETSLQEIRDKFEETLTKIQLAKDTIVSQSPSSAT
jgi:DNA invertase Pin-like site-specific DNA recombinase|tara:strand:- start:183 stop:527 length:345 start_codon:yes stop_codon:yes gene_type:complete